MTRKLAALVIGNTSYIEVPPLINPVHDAQDMSTKLTELGFSVRTLTDATKEQMELAVRDFGVTLNESSVGLMFFAGHAFQIDGMNFLAGIDTKASDPLRVKYSALHLDYVLDVMKRASAPTNFIILDACRNNPFPAYSRSVASNELAPVYAPKGTLIAFSTSPGETSQDGSGRNGPYTAALLQHISTPDLLIETMFKRVRRTLEDLSHGNQTSWEHTSLTGDFRFQLSLVSDAHGYGATATADSLFLLSNRSAGQLIEALKSYNWYTQNPALDAFTTAEALNSSTDELFIIGRNIYQAACGSANSAVTYITHFKERTRGLEEVKRKALLDGMLYEVFFDSEGLHRSKPKMGCFEEIFALQNDPELTISFTFLLACLSPYAEQYYALPGTANEVLVTVAVDPPSADGKYMLNAVWLDGTNILHQKRDHDSEAWWLQDRTLDIAGLREFLSEEMIVPKRCLSVLGQFPQTSRTQLILPSHLSLRRDS